MRPDQMTLGNRQHDTARARGRRWRACVACVLLAGWGAPGAAAVPAADAAKATPAAVSALDSGRVFIRNFEPAEYAAGRQNWAVVQGRDGVMYVGNGDDGVLSFDGARWRSIALPDRVTVRSLAVDADGRVYVGAVGELGYLAPDAAGRLRYVSLMERIPATERGFADVWQVFATPQGVYFCTFTRIFRLRGERVDVWKPAHNTFHAAFHVRGRLYVRERGHGLLQLVDDKLVAVPGGDRFASERVYVMLPWGGKAGNALLIGTRTQGWMIFDGRHYRPWRTAADDDIRRGLIYGALWLADGRLAVNTIQDGIFVLDTAGRLLRHVDKDSGLIDDMVTALYQDRRHGLWAATDAGVARIAIESPITHFDSQSGLDGLVISVGRHAGRLYAATTRGLFRLQARSDGHSRFERLPQIASQAWALLEMDGQLLVGGSGGVYEIDAGAPVLVQPTSGSVTSLLRSRRDPSRVFIGMQGGIISIRRQQDHWINEGPIADFSGEPRSMLQAADGRLWLANWDGSVARVQFPDGWNGGPAAVRVRQFGLADGISTTQPKAFFINGRVHFGTTRGLLVFDPVHGRFVSDPRFAQLFPDGPRQVSVVAQESADRVWMYSAAVNSSIKEVGAAVADSDGIYRWQPSPLQPVGGSAMYGIYRESDGIVWFGGDEGLYRYDPAIATVSDPDFAALVRAVSTTGGELIFGGTGTPGTAQLAYAHNDLRFEFAAPGFDNFDANRFQVWLEGLDAGWSSWSNEAYRDYTNLPEGAYRFHVRARDVYGHVGKPASFGFRVLPPWYRTAWAWSIWVATSVLLLVLLVRWRSGALRRRNQELAAMVARRTQELEQANATLAEQTITDPLTGLKNRRYLHDHIEQDVAVAHRHYADIKSGQADVASHFNLLFLMVDIDGFKEVNDTYGHAAGDRVLQQFRDILLSATRETDTPVRWGGEEFLVVARFVSDASGPLFAERIRATVAAHEFELGKGRSIRRTCSVGFASYPFFGDDPGRVHWEQVVNLADVCMYAAKRSGRDAWVGVRAGPEIPQGGLVEALHRSLDMAPGTGPLHVLSSLSMVIAPR